jgi:hypothetical protein
MDIPTDPVVLSPDDLQALCRLAGLAVPPDDEDAATLALAKAPDGSWRAWIAEYPEEGSVPVHRTDGGAPWDAEPSR